VVVAVKENEVVRTCSMYVGRRGIHIGYWCKSKKRERETTRKTKT
jgi:hypothetical protein